MLALIADDEALVCDLLVRFFEDHGYRVATAGDGEEAMEILRQNKPDLILLDLYMPKLNGIGVLERIREESLEVGTIWTMTGMGDDDSAKRSLRLGAADFLTKPLDLRHLDWRLKLEEARGSGGVDE